MNGRERVRAVLNHRIPDRVPAFETVIDGRMVQYVLGIEGKNSWQLGLEQNIELHRKIGLDAVYLPFVWKPRDQMTGRMTPVDRVEKPYERLESRLEAMKGEVKALHEAGLAAIAYTHGAFDVTYESLGYEHFMTLLYDEPGYIREAMDMFEEFSARVLEGFCRTGVDAVLIGDDVCYKTGLMISPKMFFPLWRPRTARLAAIVKEHGIPLEYHTDGALEPVMEALIEMGFDCVNPVDTGANDIFSLKRRYGGRIALRGNIDLSGPLALGTPEQTFLEAREKLLGLKSGGNYVCSSSHSISDAVVPENYFALMRALEAFGAYGKPCEGGEEPNGGENLENGGQNPGAQAAQGL